MKKGRIRRPKIFRNLKFFPLFIKSDTIYLNWSLTSPLSKKNHLISVSTTSVRFGELSMRMRELNRELKQRKDVFERRTSTGSETFSLLICLDANKFVLLSLFSLIKTIYPRVSTEPLSNDAKSPLPVDVRRSKTLLLKLPNQRRRSRQRKRQKSSSLRPRPLKTEIFFPSFCEKIRVHK